MIRNVFDAIWKLVMMKISSLPSQKEFCPPMPRRFFRQGEGPSERIRKGLPLWHPEDRVSFSTATSSILRFRN